MPNKDTKGLHKDTHSINTAISSTCTNSQATKDILFQPIVPLLQQPTDLNLQSAFDVLDTTHAHSVSTVIPSLHVSPVPQSLN
jgi:CMP-N-acetylneuraminic acid synthetase